MVGRLRNRVLCALADDVIFRDVSKALTQQCGRLGLSPTRFEGSCPPRLYLDPTVLTFEYPHADIPRRCTSLVNLVAALRPEDPIDSGLSAWWEESVEAERPVVRGTQDTAATKAEELIASSLEVLVDEDVLVASRPTSARRSKSTRWQRRCWMS